MSAGYSKTLEKSLHLGCVLHTDRHLYAYMCIDCSKTCLKRLLKKEDQLSLNAGQKYCRMIQGEHSAILSTFIKLPFVIKIFVLSFLTDYLHEISVCGVRRLAVR